MKMRSKEQITKRNPFGDLETLEQAFPESTYPYCGAEIEFLIVSKSNGRLLPLCDKVREALPKQVRQRTDSEFHMGQIELKTVPHRRIKDIVHEMYYTIEAVRSILSRHKADIIWTSHLSNSNFDARLISDQERSRMNVERFGDRVDNLAMCGHHFHVAVSHDQAVHVHDAMQKFLPLIAALSANSPQKVGSCERASYRGYVWNHEFSMTTFPHYYGDWKDVRKFNQSLHDAGLINSVKDVYSPLRFSRFGSLECRIFDVPLDLDHMAGLMALTQTLVKHVQLKQMPGVPDSLLHANMIQAVTYGREAKFYDVSGERKSVRALTEELIGELENTAVQLKCFDELQLLLDVFEKPVVRYTEPKPNDRLRVAIQAAAVATISAMPFFTFG